MTKNILLKIKIKVLFKTYYTYIIFFEYRNEIITTLKPKHSFKNSHKLLGNRTINRMAILLEKTWHLIVVEKILKKARFPNNFYV